MSRSCAAVSPVARRAAHAAVSPSKLARNSRSSLALAPPMWMSAASAAPTVSPRGSATNVPPPLPTADLQRAEHLHRAEGLPQRRTADAEQLGQVALGREALARLEVAVGDRRLELADHDVEGALPPHGGERLAARVRRHASTLATGVGRATQTLVVDAGHVCAHPAASKSSAFVNETSQSSASPSTTTRHRSASSTTLSGRRIAVAAFTPIGPAGWGGGRRGTFQPSSTSTAGIAAAGCADRRGTGRWARGTRGRATGTRSPRRRGPTGLPARGLPPSASEPVTTRPERTRAVWCGQMFGARTARRRC